MQRTGSVVTTRLVMLGYPGSIKTQIGSMPNLLPHLRSEHCQSTIVYPGTFDPITLGHVDLARRASRLFEKVIIAVAANSSKTPLFDLPKRLTLIQQVFAEDHNVTVESFSGLLVDWLKNTGVHLVLRGIRTLGDMEYEFQLASMNRYMYPKLETLFLQPDERYAHISSTLVREIARMNGDLSPFVPQEVIAAFK